MENQPNNEDRLLQPVMSKRGEVIGIGKFKIPKTKEITHEIQPLAFISIKTSDDSFISTCIHLRLDGYGKTEEEADKDMMENASYFISQNFSKLSDENAWDNLEELFACDDWSSELWNVYHKFQIQLSRQGNPMTDHAAEIFTRLIRILDWEKELVNREKVLLYKEKKLGFLKKELKVREKELGIIEEGLLDRKKQLEEWKNDLVNWANELEKIEIINKGIAYYLMGKLRSAGTV
ncbi:MAG: hypothetical protein FWC19_09825 [Treponema sp.]|nr:hypothetical protein [Treponema sp.]MCL2273084.1 hypothetical protein [Treponema sp.]